MNKYIAMVMVLYSINAFAEQSSCEVPCSDVTSEQKKCVLNKFCHEKKLKQQVQSLEEKNKQLEEELAKMKTKYETLVYNVHHNLPSEESHDKNAISLIGGASQTALNTESTSTVFKAKTGYQPDLGLMYQRDFNDVRGSVSATINGSIMVGAGLMF